MKTFLSRSVIGIFFGAFIAVLITSSVVWFGEETLLNGPLFVKNAFGCMFAGWLYTVSTLYFETEKLNLPIQTLLHFITITIPFFIIAIFLGWIPSDVKSIIAALVFFIILYIIIWLCFYLYFRHQSKQLNDDIQNL